jgi:tRNA threonylcarbamoyl adenosine modification protein YeaZ
VGGTANTGYETNPGPGTTVGGSNYSGLPSGLSQEDVCLQGDLSITKTAPTSVTAGQTLTYTLTPRNNGRAISDLTFSTNQATEASNTSSTTRVLSNGAVRVVDTLPAGLTLTNPVAPAGWNCSQAGQALTCDSTAPLPVAASTDLAAITGTVRVSNTACVGPLINTATVSGFQAPYADSTPANNTGTASTTLNCNANLSVSKTNGTDTVVTGTTTTYSVVFTNNGPSSADGAVLTEGASQNALGHAEAIGGLLQAALAAASSTGHPLTHVAAGMGPGPFTGLRVGIAAAHAFALGRGIPVVPVVSHDAVALEVFLAAALTDTEQPRFAVVTDARRREFAFTVYEGIDDDGLPVRATEPALIPRELLDARLSELGAERRDAGAVSGAMVASIAARAVAAGRVPAMTQPLYLRSPDVTQPHGPKRVTT